MQLHPASVEVGDDAVQIDSETHRDTLRTSRAHGSTRWFGALIVGCAGLIGITACGGDGDSDPIRAYELGLEVDDGGERYRYVATDEVDVRVGDEVTFVLHNTGALPHDLQIVDPDGAAIATAPPVASGGEARVTARFDEAGYFRLNCLVDDHLTVHEMQTVIEVTEPAG